MKVFIVVIILSTLFIGSAFVQPSSLSHNIHRFVNNAATLPHVKTTGHKRPRVKVNKVSAISFSEVNEHEKAIIAHSSISSSVLYAHQKMIKGHKKKLNKGEASTASSPLSELSAGDKTALVHKRASNVGAEAHQIQVRNLRGLYENRE